MPVLIDVNSSKQCRRGDVIEPPSSPPVRNGSIAGDNNEFGQELSESSLDRDLEGISVGDSKHFVIFDPSVEIINDDGFLTVIVVPPITPGLVVNFVSTIFGYFFGGSGFASSRFAVVDDRFCFPGPFSSLRKISK